jgi:Rad3-related DNA helicase
MGTGVGKSGLAVALARSSNQAYILTTTKILQDQYVKDFGGRDDISFTSMKGKANYPCNENGGATNCEAGLCAGGNKKKIAECRRECKCVYYELRKKALASNIFCTSYAFLFRCAQCAEWLTKRDWMILDEAHNLESQLVGFADISIDLEKILKEFFLQEEMTPEIEELRRSVPKDDAKFEVFYDWIEKVKRLVVEPKWLETEERIKELAPKFNDPHALNLLKTLHKKRYADIDKLREKLVAYMQTNAVEWVYETKTDMRSKHKVVHASPLRVDGIFQQFIAPLADRFFMMSATITDVDSYCRTMGFDRKEVAFIDFDSPFDPEKSPIYPLNSVDTKYEALKSPTNLDKIAASVNFLCNKHPDEKGIVHAGNMTITRAIKESDRFKKSDRFLYRLDDVVNQMIYEQHRNSDEPTVMVSSSMTEGISLDDDLGRFQVIVKMPFLSLGDKRVAIKSRLDPDWYESQMWSAVLQASGRATRSDDDESVTYILDKAFPWRFGRAKQRGWLPRQFIERVKSR